MKRLERRRKFHDAIINMLYPPPSSPPPQREVDVPTDILSGSHEINSIPDPENLVESRSSQSSDDDDRGSVKLTRAQRKRIRKKKLKEAAAHRRKIIGPLLPPTGNDFDAGDCDSTESGPQSVRQNAAEKKCASPVAPAEPQSCNAQSQKKLKRRRMAKKQAKEKLRSDDEVGDSKDDAAAIKSC
ncbi:hypothetical protein Nepgr_008191 [Nepenthes gracilis]|uniref:Uncharacterized protein n=1 Tax=Nepenthes gracilis TaxID=150966 RepID=A0AAD3S984_NEPGR|nr:hypothetical protein Nepgr_008191 [Nepenthes gracilis]